MALRGALASKNNEPEARSPLSVSAGVRRFQVRLTCALLAWHTSGAAIDREASSVFAEAALLVRASGDLNVGLDANELRTF
jgi:hypothetical protein